MENYDLDAWVLAQVGCSYADTYVRTVRPGTSVSLLSTVELGYFPKKYCSTYYYRHIQAVRQTTVVKSVKTNTRTLAEHGLIPRNMELILLRSSASTRAQLLYI
jgi:hypothetical protein